VDRQWVVTAYSLAFGSLLLLGGRLADLLGRKVTFMTGLIGFAGVSAIGGASVNFAMLVTARACQGAFGALLAPAALSLLTTTFTDPKDRGKAFGIYGAIAGGGGAVGLLLGGALTEYLSWRWTLYVNLVFAGVAFAGASLLLRSGSRPGAGRGWTSRAWCWSPAACSAWSTASPTRPRTAGTRRPPTASWPPAWCCSWRVRVLAGPGARPLLPPRVVLDRNRGGAYPRCSSPARACSGSSCS
jgi:MFS family permease